MTDTETGEINISIRAPARGATNIVYSHVIPPAISIRAPARGATRPQRPMFPQHGFQSALPRGERPPDNSNRSYRTGNFNPRSREGSDTDQGRLLIRTSEFQSALPRGERQKSIRSFPRSENFNPRSREGSDA